LKLDYPTPETTRASRRFVRAMKRLDVMTADLPDKRSKGANKDKDIIPTSNAFLKNFLDLLRKIFVYNPADRITAKQALQHPWFKEPAHPDDGTEAAKIRLERMRMEQEPSGYRAQLH
jgi:dual-specificity kinase